MKNTTYQNQNILKSLGLVTYSCLFDKDWTMLFINNLIYKITGYSSDEFINNKVTTFRNIIHEKYLNFVEETINVAIQKDIIWDFEYPIKHKDGSIRWINEKGHVLKNKLGEIDHLEGVIIDITKYKKINEYLDKNHNFSNVFFAKFEQNKSENSNEIKIDDHSIKMTKLKYENSYNDNCNSSFNKQTYILPPFFYQIFSTPNKCLKETIENGLENLAHILNTDNILFLKYDLNAVRLDNTYSWFSELSSDSSLNFQSIYIDNLRESLQLSEELPYYILYEFESIEINHTYLSFPLYYLNQLYGFISFERNKQSTLITPNEIKHIHEFSIILINKLEGVINSKSC